MPHLSYVGDATIGAGTNIGAATVFVNYDGVAKHRTTIGDHVRIGSDTMLVAPVTVGDGAYTAAGSVITDDVPPGAMALGRARQRNVEGWVARRRPGTPAAERGGRGGGRRPRRHGPGRAGGPVTADEARSRSQNRKSLMLFSGRAYPELAEEIAGELGVDADARPPRTTSPTARSTCASRSRSAAATPS